MEKIKTVGVLTSGGDGPGMNCAIRSVVRTAISKGLKVYGIERGFAGLLAGSFKEMDPGSVGNIMQRGGTILQTSRCLEFHQKETRKEAYNILRRKGIDGLVVIGGNGSFNGAYLLHKEHGLGVAGIPGTIDNDIEGTEYTIGFDTAVQTAVEAVDKIRDTAHSHARTFIIEVMGRKSPDIALRVGICTGAEAIVFAHTKIDYEAIMEPVRHGYERGKNSSVIIVAERDTPGSSYKIHEVLKKDHNLDTHVCVLGHTQRGGNPTSRDRFLASLMGYEATIGLVENPTGAVVTSFHHGRVQIIELQKCLETKKIVPAEHILLAQTLSI